MNIGTFSSNILIVKGSLKRLFFRFFSACIIIVTFLFSAGFTGELNINCSPDPEDKFKAREAIHKLDSSLNYPPASGSFSSFAQVWKEEEVNLIELYFQAGIADKKEPYYENGGSILHFAAKKGWIDLTAKAIKCGLDIRKKDSRGWQPLHYAVWYDREDVAEKLLKNGSSANQGEAKHKVTPMHMAATLRNSRVGQILLPHVEDVNKQDSRGRTPLHFALWNGNSQLAIDLLERGAKSEIQDEKGFTAMHVASYRGDLEIVRLLVNNEGLINMADIFGLTPLHLASERGHEKIVEHLINSGANYSSDEAGRYPLHLAAMNNNLDVVELLLETEGVEPSQQDNVGRTALHRAAWGGHVDVADLLISKGGYELIETGTNVTPFNRGGITPLHEAAVRGDTEFAKLLLAQAADPDVKDSTGKSPLSWAIKNDHFAVMELLIESGSVMGTEESDVFDELLISAAVDGNLSLIKHLINSEIDVEKQVYDGLTPLHLASFAGHLDVVKFLIDYVENIDCEDDYKNTPLHLASAAGHLEVAKSLIESGADLNYRNKGDNTPLFIALSNEHLELAKQLIRYGADVNVKNTVGWSPLNVAAYHDLVDVIELLLLSGANVNIKSPHTGRTALYHNTILEGHNAFDILVKNGADLDIKTFSGETLVHYAARYNRPELMSYLWDKGLDFEVSDNAGNTPLDLAREHEHEEIIEFIKNNINRE